VFTRLLPFLEQQTAYDATNFCLTSYDPQNDTLAATGISTLWCPSDYGVATPHPYDWGSQIWGTSYSAVAGPWEWDSFFLVSGTLDKLVPGEAARIAQLGLIYPLSSVRLAEVRDGTSNTLLFGETDYTTWCSWWSYGDGSDTLVGTTAPPNVKIPTGVDPATSLFSMYSLHPGGVNCTFGDGSVKFIKDSIDSWPYDPNTNSSTSLGSSRVVGIYVGHSTLQVSVPYILPGAKVGVWQALSTRSGGECIGADQY
jgi:prepilin-type processing-associated H-X9-DG protein